MASDRRYGTLRGAAIQAAWQTSDAELLGFLDADGTCDPRFFADLCRVAISNRTDVVLGNRTSAGNQMPLIRRIGNRVFATLLSPFSSRRVRDTASGHAGGQPRQPGGLDAAARRPPLHARR